MSPGNYNHYIIKKPRDYASFWKRNGWMQVLPLRKARPKSERISDLHGLSSTLQIPLNWQLVSEQCPGTHPIKLHIVSVRNLSFADSCYYLRLARRADRSKHCSFIESWMTSIFFYDTPESFTHHYQLKRRNICFGTIFKFLTDIDWDCYLLVPRKPRFMQSFAIL